jgi:hypothetical protein
MSENTYQQKKGKRMNIESLANSVESNIIRLFKKFKEKPAAFLTKADVMCYMYYLLVTDSSLGFCPTLTNLAPTMQKSKTFLVHAGLDVAIENQKKHVALSIGETQKETELSAWDFLVGIEMENNKKSSPETLEILSEDIQKIANYKMGYLMWLNWDSSIENDNIIEVERLATQQGNIRFYYADLFSTPINSNVRKIM